MIKQKMSTAKHHSTKIMAWRHKPPVVSTTNTHSELKAERTEPKLEEASLRRSSKIHLEQQRRRRSLDGPYPTENKSNEEDMREDEQNHADGKGKAQLLS